MAALPLFVLLGLPLAGCFSYTNANMEGLSPGDMTRIHLTQDAFSRISTQANTTLVVGEDPERQSVVGRVLSRGAGEATLELSGPGLEMFRTTVAPQDALSVQVRKIDWRRTGLLAAGIAAASSIGFHLSPMGGTTGPISGPGPENASVPLFSIRLP